MAVMIIGFHTKSDRPPGDRLPDPPHADDPQTALPCTSAPKKRLPAGPVQFPSCTQRSASGSLRATANSEAQAKSAVVSSAGPGAFVAITPARVSASTSRLLYPAADTQTARSSVSPDSRSASILIAAGDQHAPFVLQRLFQLARGILRASVDLHVEIFAQPPDHIRKEQGPGYQYFLFYAIP